MNPLHVSLGEYMDAIVKTRDIVHLRTDMGTVLRKQNSGTSILSMIVKCRPWCSELKTTISKQKALRQNKQEQQIQLVRS